MNSSALRPLSWIYDKATWLRNRSFDQGVLPSVKVNVPVVSVGNLTAGGTGKTPVIEFLVRHCLTKGIRPGIVSRGYKGEFKGIHEVELLSGAYYGDEPTMIKTHFPDVPFFVGGDRVQAAQGLLQKHSVDLLLADDAFQHRRLARDLDIVLVDATQDSSDYFVLPRGQARESLKGFGRADRIIVTKLNLPESRNVNEIKSWLRPWVTEKVWEEIVLTEMQLGSLCDLNGTPTSMNISSPIYLLSAIARPNAFQALVKKCLNVEIERHFIFSDHHNYQIDDLKPLLNLDGIIITTEKDAVKLRRYEEIKSKVFVAPLTVEPTEGAHFLYEDFDRLAQ